MDILRYAFNVVAVGISSGIIISVAILLVKQILHTFEISSK